MRGGWRALARLYFVQGAWSYERMLGVGVGHAVAPLLEALRARDPARHREAIARSADFFNANPNLAGLAVGAIARAEHDGLPGTAVQRLRTALSGPLGALGDRFFWAGLVPALSGAALAGVALGGRAWAVLAAVAAYNVVRLLTARWALATGWREGLQVGGAIGRSWLPAAADRVGPFAAFALGLAIPLAGWWLLHGAGGLAALGAVLVALAGLLGARYVGPQLTVVRYALGVLALGFLAGALRG
jgi:mannose/fructose/N-acetylgalactosamine-specific phosphotransferase system component IID